MGLKADLSRPAETPEILANKHNKEGDEIVEKEDDNSEYSDSTDDESDSERESGDESASKFVNTARPRNESPESRKVSCFLHFLYNF